MGHARDPTSLKKSCRYEGGVFVTQAPLPLGDMHVIEVFPVAPSATKTSFGGYDYEHLGHGYVRHSLRVPHEAYLSRTGAGVFNAEESQLRPIMELLLRLHSLEDGKSGLVPLRQSSRKKSCP